MAMSSTNLFTSLPSSRTHISLYTNFPINHNYVCYNNSHYKREISLAAVASTPYQPVNLDYLETEFSGHGVTFSSIGDNYCIVKMGLDNGSLATLMLPSGLITSYKAPMWHGGTLEILHTSVSKGEDGEDEAVIQGGVSFAFCCGSEDDDDDEISWSPQSWTLHQVRGNSSDSIKVELISIDSEKMVEVKQIITLENDTLSSQIVISNSKPSPVELMGSVIAHLTLSSTDATYAIGLEGSDFFCRQPFLSNFSIIPPDFGVKKTGDDDRQQQVWGSNGLKRFLSGFNASNENSSKQVQEVDGEEDDNYKHLTDQMSRIYTSAPRDFTIIDRGRRNSVMVGREGFEELYIFCPGSTLERYGKFDYVCVGQSALLKPVVVAPGGTWKGTMQLHNPNL